MNRLLLLLPLVLVGCSSLVTKLEDATVKIGNAAGEVQMFAGQVNDKVQKLNDKIDEFDTNKDGSVSWDELLAGLGILGGGLGYTVAKVNAKSSDRTRRLHEKIDRSVGE